MMVRLFGILALAAGLTGFIVVALWLWLRARTCVWICAWLLRLCAGVLWLCARVLRSADRCWHRLWWRLERARWFV